MHTISPMTMICFLPKYFRTIPAKRLVEVSVNPTKITSVKSVFKSLFVTEAKIVVLKKITAFIPENC